MIRITRLRLVLALAACGLAPAAFAALGRAPASSPTYFVLETEHESGNDEYGRSVLAQYAVARDTLTRAQRVQFTHLPGEAPRGDVSTGGVHSYIVVRRDSTRDTADLLHMYGSELNTWSTDVYPGSRPCSAPEGDTGGVYATLGTPEGPGDNVHIAHFDAAGTAHKIFASHALALHLIAVRTHDILAYRVNEEHSSLLRIARDSGAILNETAVLGYARDFSASATHVFYSNRSEADESVWLAQSWDPSSGALTTLSKAADQSPMLFGDAPESNAQRDSYVTDRDPSHLWQTERRTSASEQVLLRSAADQRTWVLGNEHVELEGVGFAAGETLR